MTERIYIARHGFRSSFLPASAQSMYTSPTGVIKDYPLTSHGITQASELAHYIYSLPIDKRPDWILSSAYYRCVKTSEPIAKLLKVDIRVEEGIGEWYLPAQNGLHPKVLLADQLKTFVPEINSQIHSSFVRPCRRGESQDMLHERTKCFLSLLFKFINSLAVEERPKNVLLVTHAATNIALGRALTGQSEREVRTGCCSLGEYIRGDGKTLDIANWDQVRNGDCSFLEGGEERNWAFSFVEEYVEDGTDPDDGAEGDTFVINPYLDSRHPAIQPDISGVRDAKM